VRKNNVHQWQRWTGTLLTTFALSTLTACGSGDVGNMDDSGGDSTNTTVDGTNNRETGTTNDGAGGNDGNTPLDGNVPDGTSGNDGATNDLGTVPNDTNTDVTITTDAIANDSGPNDTGTTGNDSGNPNDGSTGSDSGCTNGATQSCYGGAQSELGPGRACRAGTQTCINGTFGPCIGEVRPSAEACNNVDDNCNGTTDENLGTVTCGLGQCTNTVSACSTGIATMCRPGTAGTETCNNRDDDCDGATDEDGCSCVYVSPTGLDTNVGTAANPMRTIAAAIAAANTAGRAPRVCVTCGTTAATINYAENITMRDGISVFGGYLLSGTVPARGTANCITGINPSMATGVVFPSTVTSSTALDGFRITGAALATSAAITVNGSTGAVISNNTITGGGTTASSIAIDILPNGTTAATPVIANNRIEGGPLNTPTAIGIQSTASAPIIQSNCTTVDAQTSRCTGGCTIRSRVAGTVGTAAQQSYGVRLDRSPNARIDTNSICGNGGVDAAGVRLLGNSAGVVIRANHISGSGGTANAVGVWLDPCASAAPWIVNNVLITGNSPTAGA